MKKSVTKNFIYNLIYQIIILIVPFATTPYVSRVLQSDGVGTYSYIYSIVTYFILLGSLGISMYAQREIAYVQDNKEKRSKVFFEIIFLRFITMSIALVTYMLIFGRMGENVIFFRIFALEIIANSLEISWFFQGIEDFKKTVVRNIIFKILGVFCIFTLVKTKEDLDVYILIYVLSNIVGNLSLWLYLPKYIQRVNFKTINLFIHLKPTILLFIPQVAVQIYTVLDKTMIGFILKDMNEVGYYEQSQRIVKMALALVMAYGTVMCPRYANAASNNEKDKINEYLDKSFTIACSLGIAITFGIIGIAENFVPWFFGTGYEKVVILLIIASPLAIIIGLNNVSGVQYLIQTKKQNVFSKSVILGAIINFCFNVVGIYFLKSIGATIASVVAEFIILIYQLIYINKNTNYPVKKIIKISVNYFISGIIMMIIIKLIEIILPVNILGTFIQIVIGAFVYVLILIALKDKFILDIIKMSVNKLKLMLNKGN